MPRGLALMGDAYREKNLGLKPQRSDTYEAGVNFNYHGLESSLTYFYSKLENRIAQRTSHVEDKYYLYQNLGEATRAGLEGMFSYNLRLPYSEWSFVPFGNFVYMDEYENEETGNDLPYISDWTINWGLRALNKMRGFSADLNFTYNGDQIGYDPPRHIYKKAGTKTNIGGFTVANLSVRKRIVKIGNYGDFSLKGDIRNLFDKNYAYTDTYPMPGRTFYLGLRYQY